MPKKIAGNLEISIGLKLEGRDPPHEQAVLYTPLQVTIISGVFGFAVTVLLGAKSSRSGG